MTIHYKKTLFWQQHQHLIAFFSLLPSKKKKKILLLLLSLTLRNATLALQWETCTCTAQYLTYDSLRHHTRRQKTGWKLSHFVFLKWIRQQKFQKRRYTMNTAHMKRFNLDMSASEMLEKRNAKAKSSALKPTVSGALLILFLTNKYMEGN